MQYEIFFFKEHDRNIDLDELFAFFNYYSYITPDYSKGEEEVLFRYHNPVLELNATFHLTKVSKVPDIYRLDPRYLDLDIYLSIDPMMPLFKVGVIMDIVGEMCNKFNFCIYNQLFENITEFNKALILKSYELIRKAYRDSYPMEYTSLTYVEKDKVNDIFKYLNEKKDLEQYYKHENLYFPTPHFIKGQSNGKIYISVDLVDDETFVFPPKTDLVFYNINGTRQIYYYDEIVNELQKFLYDLPGFIHNTKVLDNAYAKKVRKILTKGRFSEVSEGFTQIPLENIIDF